MGRDATPIAAGRHVTFGRRPEISGGMDATGPSSDRCRARCRWSISSDGGGNH